ncbi:hypothetical protein J437_LFUL003245, partial [Ladona fulva]
MLTKVHTGEFHGIALLDLHRELHKKYGDIVFFGGFPGRRDVVIIYRPEEMEAIFRNEGEWPIRDGMQSMVYYRKITRKDFYKDDGGVMVDQGEKWMEARSKANQPMMQPRISKQYIRPIAAIAYVALDKRLGCLAPNLTVDSEPQRMIDAVNDFFETTFRLEMVILMVSVKYVNEAVEQVKKRKEKGDAESEPSVLERLLARSDTKSAIIMAQDMLFGGVDTTSYSMAMAMYFIAKNQDKQEMLLKEIKRFLPNKNDEFTDENIENMMYFIAKNQDKQEMLFKEIKKFLPNKSDEFTDENIENMKYLKACLKESSRIEMDKAAASPIGTALHTGIKTKFKKE